jgi:hypothetical protein
MWQLQQQRETNVKRWQQPQPRHSFVGGEHEANRAGWAQPLPAGNMFVSHGFLELD